MQENSWDGGQMFMATSTLVLSHVFCAYKKIPSRKEFSKAVFKVCSFFLLKTEQKMYTLHLKASFP